MDITAISGAITAIRHILDIGKNIEDQRIAGAITSAVIEVQGKLLEAQQLVGEVQDENRRLKDEIRDLKAQQDLESSVAFHDGAYWRTRKGQEEGPFCPSCWGVNKKLVVLTVWDSS